MNYCSARIKYFKMCSIDREGNCTNWYCSCPDRIYGIHLTKKWLVYELEKRLLWNRVIGLFINFYRKPSHYPSELSIEEHKRRRTKTDELRKKYGLLEDDCYDEDTKDNL